MSKATHKRSKTVLTTEYTNNKDNVFVKIIATKKIGKFHNGCDFKFLATLPANQ